MTMGIGHADLACYLPMSFMYMYYPYIKYVCEIKWVSGSMYTRSTGYGKWVGDCEWPGHIGTGSLCDYSICGYVAMWCG